MDPQKQNHKRLLCTYQLFPVDVVIISLSQCTEGPLELITPNWPLANPNVRVTLFAVS